MMILVWILLSLSQLPYNASDHIASSVGDDDSRMDTAVTIPATMQRFWSRRLFCWWWWFSYGYSNPCWKKKKRKKKKVIYCVTAVNAITHRLVICLTLVLTIPKMAEIYLWEIFKYIRTNGCDAEVMNLEKITHVPSQNCTRNTEERKMYKFQGKRNVNIKNLQLNLRF